MPSERDLDDAPSRTTSQLKIRAADAVDFEPMWAIFHEIATAGDTYVFSAETPRADAFAYWFGPGVTSSVAEAEGRIVGMYKIVRNQPDRGSHVANASFMVACGHRGRGVGRRMGEHALREARRQGFLAMQFNCVVSTNLGAVALWKSLGFAIVGTLPAAFRHQALGYVDVYVMYRSLHDVDIDGDGGERRRLAS